MKDEKFTAYEILQVSPHASPDVIKAAHRAMSKAAHPDAGGSNELAVAVNEAADVLLDPLKRSRYDLELRIGKAKTFAFIQRERVVEKVIERVIEVHYVVCVGCHSNNRVTSVATIRGGKCGKCGLAFEERPESKSSSVASEEAQARVSLHSVLELDAQQDSRLPRSKALLGYRRLMLISCASVAGLLLFVFMSSTHNFRRQDIPETPAPLNSIASASPRLNFRSSDIKFTVGKKPSSISVDSRTNAWVTNSGDNTVTKLAPSGAIIGTYPVGRDPTALEVDTSDNAWTVNSDDNTVTKISSAGMVLGTYPVGKKPLNIAVSSNGDIWTVNTGDNTVTRLSSTGSSLGTYSVGKMPIGIAISRDANVWITNTGDNTVVKLSPQGEILKTCVTGTSPIEVKCDNYGNAWVANSNSNSVSKISPLGISIGCYPAGEIPGSLGDYSVSIAVASDGSAWVASSDDNTVSHLSPVGNTMGTYRVGDDPGPIDIDKSGHIWVISTKNKTVTELSDSGKTVSIHTVGNGANSIAISRSGDIWILNNYEETISLISKKPLDDNQ